MLGDYYLKNMDLTIPMIDYDEQNDKPLWIHVERAFKVTPTVFKNYFSGLSPFDLVELAKANHRGKTISDEQEQLKENNEHIANFIDMCDNYELAMGDFAQLANWGVYNNKVVVIDIGGSTEIIQRLYMKKG